MKGQRLQRISETVQDRERQLLRLRKHLHTCAYSSSGTDRGTCNACADRGSEAYRSTAANRDAGTGTNGNTGTRSDSDTAAFTDSNTGVGTNRNASAERYVTPQPTVTPEPDEQAVKALIAEIEKLSKEKLTLKA